MRGEVTCREAEEAVQAQGQMTVRGSVHPAPARSNTRGEALMAELQSYRAQNRRRKTTRVRRLRLLRVETDRDLTTAEAILAELPPEPPLLTASRRAVLDCLPLGDLIVSATAVAVAPGWAVRAAAEVVLRHLPPDPDAAEHRRILLEAVTTR